jgi:uncharacterized tellurite resistance protein B-like protein
MDREVLAALEQSDEIDMTLAYALMLVDLAAVDSNFADEEYAVISGLLKRNFEVTPEEAERLIIEARAMLHPFRGALGFAEQLTESLAIEERRKLMRMLDEVISADNSTHDLETYLRNRFSQLLGLEMKLVAESK